MRPLKDREVALETNMMKIEDKILAEKRLLLKTRDPLEKDVIRKRIDSLRSEHKKLENEYEELA